ncbi:MAG: tetratricopeptide repeat protein [Chloroflexota bacterium]
MEMTRARGGLSDRTLNRLIVGIAVALVIGVPAIGLIYFLDRNVDPGPSMSQRSIDSAEAAVRTEPNRIGARLQLAGAYLAADRTADAAAQYTEILAAEPSHRMALLGRGKAYLAANDLVAAKKDFGKMVDDAKSGEMANVDPQLEAAYYLLGQIALTESRPADAVTFLTSALQIDRADADAMNLLGTALIATGKPQDAVDILRRAVAFVPTGWCEPYAQLTTAYAALGQADGASYSGGMVSFCEGRPDEARAQLQPLVNGTLAVDAMLGLALIATAEGDDATATTLYGKVLEKDPESFSAITGLKGLATSDTGATTRTTAAPPAANTSPSPSAAGN